MAKPRMSISAVTVKDLKVYFGKKWDGGWKDDSFKGELAGVVDAKIWADGVTYWVKTEAVDDPSDSDETSTEAPLKAIADFLGQDLPGGEHFDRMSSSPVLFAGALRAAAFAIGSGRTGRRVAELIIRRLSSIPSYSKAAVPGDDAMSELEEKARKKGWEAKLKTGPDGERVLEIDVSGVYRSEVSMDSIMYGYSFSVRGKPGVSEEGTTEDPIREFEKWGRRDDMKDAVGEAQEDLKDSGTVKAPEGGATVKAPEGGMTVPAPDDQAKKVVKNHDEYRRAPRRAPMEEPLS